MFLHMIFKKDNNERKMIFALHPFINVLHNLSFSACAVCKFKQQNSAFIKKWSAKIITLTEITERLQDSAILTSKIGLPVPEMESETQNRRDK